MNAPTTDNLVQRRQQRCRELVAAISAGTQGPRTPPEVVFVDKAGSTRGEFSWRHNRVTVVISGFLDDPATLDESIDAVVAHEMGHWADPDVAREARRAVGFGVPILFAAAPLLILTLLLPPLPSLVAALSTIVMGVTGFWVIARLSWPGEERADRFAVDQVGIDAVVAMLENPPKKAARGITPTHPSMRRRLRLARLHEQKRSPATVRVDVGADIGSGTGWLLVDTNVTVHTDTLPIGFASTTEPGADAVLRDWRGGHFESGLLWLHQTSAAAVLAVPTARWDGSGYFQFFLWRGSGPVLPMPAWSGHACWNRNSGGFHAAQRAAQSLGSAALGIGHQPA